jgi:hypothetical protein
MHFPWIEAVLQFPAGPSVVREDGQSTQALAIILFTHEIGHTAYFTSEIRNGPTDHKKLYCILMVKKNRPKHVVV